MEAASAADALLRPLNAAIRSAIRRRIEKMDREYSYLRTQDHEDLLLLFRTGWSDQKFHVLFVLNSLYQLCIGPLHASARASGVIGREVAIRHGADEYGQLRARQINAMAQEYESLAMRLGYDPALLQKNTCGDLVYWLARWERERNSTDGD